MAALGRNAAVHLRDGQSKAAITHLDQTMQLYGKESCNCSSCFAKDAYKHAFPFRGHILLNFHEPVSVFYIADVHGSAESLILGLYVGTDALVALSSYCILITLLIITRKQPSISFDERFSRFLSAVLCAYGTTHLIALWMLCHPPYWLVGTFKTFVAAVAVYAAIKLLLIISSNSESSLVQIATGSRDLHHEVEESYGEGAALQTSEAELYSIFAAMNDLVLVRDAEGRCLRIAPTQFASWVVAQEEMLGKTLHEIMPQTEADFVLSHIHQALETQQSVSCEYNLLIQERSIWFAAVISPLTTETVVLVARDISQHKQVEEALKAREQQLQLALEASGHGLWDWAIQKGDLYLSPQWTSMLGYAPDELPAQVSAWEQLIHPEDKPWVMERLSAHLQSVSVSYNFDYRLQTKSGGWKWVANYGGIVTWDEQGQPIRMVGTHHDISDRKAAEAALQQKTEELEVFFSSALDLLCIANTEGYFLRLNPEWEQTLGYTLQELEGRRFLDLVHPEDVEPTLTAITELSARKPLLQFTNRYRHRDGSYRWIEWRSLPKNGLIYAAARDITGRIQAEERLQIAESRYRNLIEQIPGVVYTSPVRATPESAYISPQVCQLLGTSSEDWTGDFFSSWAKYVHPDDLANLQQEVNTTIDTGIPLKCEYRMITRDGKTIWVSDQAQPIYDPSGHAWALQGVVFEVTDRKQNEATIQESEARFRSAFEDAAIGMAMVANDGKFLRVNHSLCEILGYSHQELLKTDVQAITHPEDLTADLACIKQLLKGEKRTYQLEKRYFNSQGDIVWALLSVSLVRDKQEKPLYFISQIQDITASKIATARIQDSLKEKEVLLKEIHHRVKNNLQVVNSLFRLQKRTLHDSKIAMLLTESQNRLRSMALIHEKLYQSSNFSSIDLADYIQDLAQSLIRSYLTNNKQVNLDINIPRFIFIGIDAAVPFGLIINELVSNALKYAFEPEEIGELWIHAGVMNDSKLILTIGDNGKGLPIDFDFEQSQTLGLNLVKDLVSQLQGTLELDMTKGTQFRIILDQILN